MSMGHNSMNIPLANSPAGAWRLLKKANPI